MREMLRTIQAGALPPPPSAAALGLRIADVGPDRAVFALVPSPDVHLNASGTVNGGVLATLADYAVCSSVNDLPVSVPVATASLSLTYQVAVTVETGEIWASAKVLHRSERSATVVAEIRDEAGRLYVHAVGTVVIGRRSPEQ